MQHDLAVYKLGNRFRFGSLSLLSETEIKGMVHFCLHLVQKEFILKSKQKVGIKPCTFAHISTHKDIGITRRGSYIQRPGEEQLKV